ncbi:MAG: hypothetical protein JSS43_17925 [Proteobacteria bacterium]|nr:hypothetical protein [Pseudomonadota bacterium]
MPVKDHQLLIEDVLTWARECLVNRGRLEFMVFTIDEQGKQVREPANPACFAADGSRERLAGKMRADFRKAGIVRYAIAAECWVTRPATLAGPLRVPQIGSDASGREEVVIVHVCDRRHASVHVAAILRDPRTGAALGLRKLMTTNNEESLIAGRFHNLLEGAAH